MRSNCGAEEGSWESLRQQGGQTSQSEGKATLNTHWKDWCWSWSSSILVTWCEQPTLWKSPWCWERLRAEGEEGIRGWDGWMASPMQWTWTWANFGRWGGTGRPGMLQSMGSPRVRHDWVTEQQQSCKKIKPINPKRNQPWTFIGKTDPEAEAPMLWQPDAKSWLTGKDPDAGKDWGQEEKGMTEDEMAG